MQGLRRRGFLVVTASILAGCGGDGGTPTPDNPALGEVTPGGGLALSSSAFDDGGSIPDQYGRETENVNPPLDIEGVPERTDSFALVVDDPDAPGGSFLHWLVWNVPSDRREIPVGWSPTEATEGENDFGTTGYDGPAPPEGEEHRYRFKLYALDATLSLPLSASRGDVGDAMRGHVLSQSQLSGTYAAG